MIPLSASPPTRPAGSRSSARRHQSAPFRDPRATTLVADEQAKDIDDGLKEPAEPQDILVIEVIGLTAAAAGPRRRRSGASAACPSGSGVRCARPAQAAEEAITAFLGLLLMRGQFVPGLSALDTSAQILAWALVFGYAQELFTRLVDRQGQTVLEA